MDYHSIVLEVGVEPQSPADRSTLAAALAKLKLSDPTLYYWIDPNSGEAIIGGTSETHLEAAVHALVRTCGVALTVCTPTISYRETISKAVEIDYTHEMQSDGACQYARINIRFDPLKRGEGFVFESAVASGSVPNEYVSGVEKGVASSRQSGVLRASPVIDFKATLVDVDYRDLDSSVMAFEIAADAAFREGMEKGGPKLLEPIMQVEVVAPERYLGDVVGDLNSRRGLIQGFGERHGDRSISALVPLSEMMGYGAWLNSACGRTGNYVTKFSHYDVAPPMPDIDPPFGPAAALRA